MTQIMEIRPISRESDAKEVALASYDDLLDLIDSLADEDWRIPTECPGWTVEDMVGHLIGAAKANASKREMLRQQLWGYRHSRDFDGNPLDAANALQVRHHADLTATERGPRIEMNAIEFCRTLSGRAHGTGLLATKIWF